MASHHLLLVLAVAASCNRSSTAVAPARVTVIGALGGPSRVDGGEADGIEVAFDARPVDPGTL